MTTPLLTWTITLFIISFGFALRSLYLYMMEKQALKEHVSETAAVSGTGRLSNESMTKRQKIQAKLFSYADDFSAIGERFNFFSESEDVTKWIMQAGSPKGLTTSRLQGLKIVMLFIGFFTGVALTIIGFPFARQLIFLLPIAGYFGTIFWIKGLAKQRQRRLSDSLPDFIDTIGVTIQAGTGLDQALQKITPYFDGPIQEEFARFNQRIRLGVSREDAYRELIERSDAAEFHSLIKALIQGSRLGIPVAKTIKIQSDEIRKLKREKVKEAASKASPKVTLITTFVVMPTAMIFIAGLLLLNLIANTGGMFNVLN